jgi:hypothetical protein
LKYHGYPRRFPRIFRDDEDFIFVTERFAESLLAFKARWNLTFAQLLHVQLHLGRAGHWHE